MVAQLAAPLKAEPNDLDGWLRLAKAYSVLGKRDDARAAWAKAAAPRRRGSTCSSTMPMR